MAVKDGLPSTDFSRMNREYIKELIEESGGGGGGESDVVFVTYYFDDTTSDFIRCSMTPAEINTALNSKNAVIAKTIYVDQNNNSENFTYVLYLPNSDMTYVSNEEFYFNFDSIQPRIERTPDGVRLFVVNLHHDETGVTLNDMQLFIDATT